MDVKTPWPLAWPAGWTRTAYGSRKPARFSKQKTDHYRRADGSTYSTTRKDDLSVFESAQRLLLELKRFGVRDGDIVLTTNLHVRLDGLPRSNQARPTDPGAAVYFILNGKPRCLACDKYTTVEGNIAALAAHVDALRAVARYGVGTVDQAFTGYTALPAAADVEWWLVLNVPRVATVFAINEAYRTLARKAHPDAGGSEAEMARLNAARDAALREKGGA